MNTGLLGKEKLIEMYRRMLTIRRFEERVRYLFLEGIMPGTIHQCDGQEATSVGVCSALAEGDMIASTHRPHGHALARGLDVHEMMAELFGKPTGCCKGFGGSMHVGNIDKGMIPAIAIVGGNLPIVSGMALAFKMQKKPNVAISFFGDGASNEGAFHEAINFAAIYDLPAIFVCENNFYGASTPISLTYKNKKISDRAAAYGIEGVTVENGNDVLEVYEAASRLIEKARNGGGPAILELMTFRRCGHSRRDAKLYMDKALMQEWMDKDPLDLFAADLLEGVCDQALLDKISDEVDEEIERAVEDAIAAPDPKPEDALLYVFN